MTAVILVRIYEIPRVEPGFDVDDFLKPPTAEQLETLRLYDQAQQNSRPMQRRIESGAASAPQPGVPGQPETEKEPTLDELRRWVADNQTTIVLTLEASRHPVCAIWDAARGQTRVAGRLFLLDELLLASACVLEADGKLDEAWERYTAALHLANCKRTRAPGFIYFDGDGIERQVFGQLPQWAGHSQQEPKRIRTAIHNLELLSREVPSATTIVEDAYVEAVVCLDADLARRAPNDPRFGGAGRATRWLLPWETARTTRLARRLPPAVSRELKRWNS